jgi:hypothetical protein
MRAAARAASAASVAHAVPATATSTRATSHFEQDRPGAASRAAGRAAVDGGSGRGRAPATYDTACRSQNARSEAAESGRP